MFRKYEKTYRLIKGAAKYSLGEAEIKSLFAGQVTVEEKLDGANVGIIRHKRGFHLQKRGSLVGPSEHAQFQYFHGWANQIKYDSIMALPVGTIVYGELLYAVHTIYYDKLPDYVIMFDVWDGKKERYLDFDTKYQFIKDHGFYHVPVIAWGDYKFKDMEELMPDKSEFGDVAEGIVVKRYTKKGGFFKGKIVKPEFIKSLDESDHWIHQKFKRNKIQR